MSLLLSNDDGVYAPGLVALERCLRRHDQDLRVVAPNRDRSGVSNSLTLDRPLHAQLLPNNFLMVDGTPTDCIHLGTSEIFMPLPQRVVSGINFGANLGDDVLYFGTVAAAMEGRFLEKPALAVSLVASRPAVDVEYFAEAAKITHYLLGVLDRITAPARTVYNINLPDLPLHEIRGVRLTVLGQRLRGENPVSVQNPRGKTLYWIGRAGGPVDAREGTDFHAVENGYISVTPIHADMTLNDCLDEMRDAVNDDAEALKQQVGRMAEDTTQ